MWLHVWTVVFKSSACSSEVFEIIMCDADDENEGQCRTTEDAVDDVPEAVELS